MQTRRSLLKFGTQLQDVFILTFHAPLIDRLLSVSSIKTTRSLQRFYSYTPNCYQQFFVMQILRIIIIHLFELSINYF